MSISYALDRPKSLPRTTCTGEVRLPEVLAHFDQLQRDPERPWRWDVLLDFAGLRTPPGVPEVRGVAFRIQHVLDFGFARCAVVAGDEGAAEVWLAR